MRYPELDLMRHEDRAQLLTNQSVLGSSEHGWTSLFFERIEGDRFETIEHTLSNHYLMVKLNPLSHAERQINGELRRERQRRGTTVYLPNGCPHRVRYIDHLGQLCMMALAPHVVSNVADELGVNRLDDAPIFMDRNDFLLETALSISHELQQGNPHGPIFADIYARLLAAQIVTMQRSKARARREPQATLTSRQLKWLDEYIDSNLAYKITLDDLANQAGLSTFYFCRTFKAATGYSPHLYVMNRRIAFAKSCLSSDAVSILDTALSAGFSDSAHFSRQFKKSVGMTPSQYHRDQVVKKKSRQYGQTDILLAL